LIFLWKINDNLQLNTEVVRIAALLNWAILFIIDDFMKKSRDRQLANRPISDIFKALDVLFDQFIQ